MKLLLAFDNDIGGIKATLNAIKKIFELKAREERIFNLRLKFGLPISKQISLEEEFEIDDAIKNITYEPTRKPEREKIFLEDGSVTLGEAFEAKRNYLENKLMETAKSYFEIQQHNEKYPEFILELPNLKKPQNDYDWHLKLNANSKDINIDAIKATRKIGEFITLVRGFACCPFHKEKTPSFNVNEKKNLWYCFGCGEGGSVIDFVMKLNNYSFIEAIKYLS